MALLTEEQINDILDITNVCFSSSSAKKLLDWNEKQQPTKFEPDWSTAPDYAVMVAINISWLTESGSWTHGYRLATYDRPSVAHPHAALMSKYAEVAARRVDPWVEFERFSHCDMEWDGLPYHPDWTQGQEYRHIGDDK